MGMCRFVSAHHDVHVFIEFCVSRRFANEINDSTGSGYVGEEDKLFFGPLKDANVAWACRFVACGPAMVVGHL